MGFQKGVYLSSLKIYRATCVGSRRGHSNSILRPWLSSRLQKTGNLLCNRVTDLKLLQNAKGRMDRKRIELMDHSQVPKELKALHNCLLLRHPKSMSAMCNIPNCSPRLGANRSRKQSTADSDPRDASRNDPSQYLLHPELCRIQS